MPEFAGRSFDSAMGKMMEKAVAEKAKQRGATAHSDPGRRVAETFLAAARGQAPGYEMKDERKLYLLQGENRLDPQMLPARF